MRAPCDRLRCFITMFALLEVVAALFGLVDFAETATRHENWTVVQSTMLLGAFAVIACLPSVQAGAGIVADSVGETEWEETESKARALLSAIGQARGAA